MQVGYNSSRSVQERRRGTSTGRHANSEMILCPFIAPGPFQELLYPISLKNWPDPSGIQYIMGFFSRTKKPEVHIHNYTYQQTVRSSRFVRSIAYANPFSKTAVVANFAPRLPACRKCSSAQKTQLAVTQNGPNTGRQYYVCIGCPAPGTKGRSWIVWADQIKV